MAFIACDRLPGQFCTHTHPMDPTILSRAFNSVTKWSRTEILIFLAVAKSTEGIMSKSQFVTMSAASLRTASPTLEFAPFCS
jgi:hypothetical protein